jgi:glycerol-3-phosphate dehydrogenase (NAD(P)+)
VALGRGELPSGELAEGVFTAPVALQLARQAEIDAPLIEAVNLLLGGHVSIEKIVAGLMSRPLKREN